MPRRGNNNSVQENSQITSQGNIQNTPISPQPSNLSRNYTGNQQINIQPKINGTSFNHLECFNHPVSLNTSNYMSWRINMLYLLDINNLVDYVS